VLGSKISSNPNVMARTNYFSATVTCPTCHVEQAVDFEADIGVIENAVFQIGDRVVTTVPPVPKRAGKNRIAVGPAIDVDWQRPFWAVGVAVGRACGHEVVARIHVRDGRFTAAVPTVEPLDVLAWDYLD